jgi:predicted ArsR family transcriptional regulator
VVLREILKIMSEEGSITTNDISQRLGVSKGLVELAIHELSRRGLVKEIKNGEVCPCSSCILKDICNWKSPRYSTINVYFLTEKGRKTLKNPSE